MWRHAVIDVAEGLLGRSLAPGAVAEQTRLERGTLGVDGIVSDVSGATHPGLSRLAALANAPSLNARARLFERAVRVIQASLPADQARGSIEWAAKLSVLYLEPGVVNDVLERSSMPIDLSQTTLAIQARDEGQRDMVRRALATRFGDPALTARVSQIPDALLPDAIDLLVTADADADEFTAWLDAAITGPEPSTDPDWDARCAEIFASVEDLFECLRPDARPNKEWCGGNWRSGRGSITRLENHLNATCVLPQYVREGADRFLARQD